MAWYNFLTSADKAAEKALDGIIDGVDALVLTDEEKLKYQADASKLWLKIQEQIRDESSIRSLTRRYISLSALFSYLIMGFLAIAIYEVNREYAEFILKIMEGKLGFLVIGVGAFYLGPHMIGRMKK